MRRLLICCGVVAAVMVVVATAHAQEKDWTRSVEGYVEQAMKEGSIPSLTIAVVRGREIVFSQAYGYSNLWAKTPATLDTVYLIGSTFKAMSTFALLQQMEDGKFRLDDPVHDYLKDLPIRGEDPKHPVTFRHVLTHTSGLATGFGGHLVWGDSVPMPLKDYLAEVLRVSRPPQEEWEYSNVGFALVGLLVEQFSETPYRDYIKAHIFEPLEMVDTEFIPGPDMYERLAIPYEYDPKTQQHSPALRLKADAWPAGIVYGTVLGQANWLIANLNRGEFKGRRILREETVDEVMRRQYDQFTGPVEGIWLNDSTGLGLSWWISKENGETLFAHSGSVPGYTAWIVGNRDRKTGVAILTNGSRSHPHLAALGQKTLSVIPND